MEFYQPLPYQQLWRIPYPYPYDIPKFQLIFVKNALPYRVDYIRLPTKLFGKIKGGLQPPRSDEG